MKILVATGIYPPEIGGPAKYAKYLAEAFREEGHLVEVEHFGKIERKLVTGFRHLYFLLKIIPAVFWADWIVALDTFSVGLPTVLLAKIFRKKVIIRTGGDFLWENFVERTGKKIFLRDFYKTSIPEFSLKEKIIFALTGLVLRNANMVAFSTSWQREIFLKPYKIKEQNTVIVENCIWPKRGEGASRNTERKVFVGGTRILKWKNLDLLKEAFSLAEKRVQNIELDLENSPPDEFLNKIDKAYAVILVSFGDISPNMILEAISYNKPFILTKENGLNAEINKLGVLVDPLNKEEIAEKIVWLSDIKNYESKRREIENYNFVRTYEDIAKDFINLFEKLNG